MKHTSHTEVIIIAATAIFIIVIASFFFLRKDKDSFIPKQVVTPPDLSQAEAGGAQGAALPDNSELEADYRERAVDILKVYSPDSLNFSGAKQAYEQVVEDLLELKVPRSYQNIHLELVLSFEKMSELAEKAAEGDKQAQQELIEVKENLEELFANYPWLRS